MSRRVVRISWLGFQTSWEHLSLMFSSGYPVAFVTNLSHPVCNPNNLLSLAWCNLVAWPRLIFPKEKKWRSLSQATSTHKSTWSRPQLTSGDHHRIKPLLCRMASNSIYRAEFGFRLPHPMAGHHLSTCQTPNIPWSLTAHLPKLNSGDTMNFVFY